MIILNTEFGAGARLFVAIALFPVHYRSDPSVVSDSSPLSVTMSLLAIFSDVHGNVRNLEYALTYLQSRGIDSYLQLGDLGVEPLPLLDGLPVRHVFGNWEVSGLSRFPRERQPEVATWPAHRSGKTWVAAHASPVFPAQCTDLAATRRYMAEHRPRWMRLFPSLLHDENAIWSAIAELEAQDRLVAFHGHTHVQAVQQLGEDNRLRRIAGPVIELLPNTRTLIGVGSLGEPRDGRALRCVLFDAETAQVELVTIPDPSV
jgi:predicted phosphodiesterase